MSVRLKLTLLYGGLFLLAGAALLAIIVTMMRAGFAVPGRILVADPSSPGDVIQVGPAVLPAPSAAGRSQTRIPLAAPTELIEAYRRRVEAAAFQQLLTRSGIALAIMTVVSVGLGYLVAGRVLHPLHAITTTAKRLSEQTLHQRINLQGPHDELKELADTFDAMLARLDAAFASQRRFVANASHELRTPLTITRTEVDVTLASRRATLADYQAMAERVRQATDRSQRLLDSLLVLADSDRNLPAREPVDLADTATEALRHAEPEIARLGLRVSRTLHAAPVPGDRALLERLTGNLVDNAVRHNHPDGWIHVDTGPSGDRATIHVANSGPPIPPEQVDSLFEPFHRLAGRVRSVDGGDGVGLGLSIVRSVAAAHGGRVTARALTSGGLEVTVQLPATSPEQPESWTGPPSYWGHAGPVQATGDS